MTEIRWAKLEDAQDLGFVHSVAYRNAYQGIIPDEYLNQVTPNIREKYFHNALLQGTARWGRENNHSGEAKDAGGKLQLLNKRRR